MATGRKWLSLLLLVASLFLASCGAGEEAKAKARLHFYLRQQGMTQEQAENFVDSIERSGIKFTDFIKLYEPEKQ